MKYVFGLTLNLEIVYNKILLSNDRTFEIFFYYYYYFLYDLIIVLFSTTQEFPNEQFPSISSATVLSIMSAGKIGVKTKDILTLL